MLWCTSWWRSVNRERTFYRRALYTKLECREAKGELQKEPLQRKELYGAQGRTSRGLSVRGKWVAPVADAFVAKLFDKSFGATPPEKPAPERSTTDMSFKEPCFNAFSP